MASFARRIERAGVKVVAIFPYAFVDTSEAWFEPRRRRIAVSLAGPVADFTLGGAFAIACARLPPGPLRDILFNLALAAYIGGFFNLNPLLERDGYHVLVDVLREPGLRRRAGAQLNRRLSGAGSAGESRVLARYAAFGIGWSVVGSLCAIGMSLRYERVLAGQVGDTAAHVLMGALWALFFVPVLVMVGRPLVWRLRGREPLTASPSVRN
jgi:putative peptide zinc metalloprotease protein